MLSKQQLTFEEKMGMCCPYPRGVLRKKENVCDSSTLWQRGVGEGTLLLPRVLLFLYFPYERISDTSNLKRSTFVHIHLVTPTSSLCQWILIDVASEKLYRAKKQAQRFSASLAIKETQMKTPTR